jgi:hypothetical protein
MALISKGISFAVVVASVSFMTKPTMKSFETFFSDFIKEKLCLPPIIGTIAGFVGNSTLPRETHDYVFARFVTVGDLIFLGIFNSICLCDLNKSHTHN